MASLISWTIAQMTECTANYYDDLTDKQILYFDRMKSEIYSDRRNNFVKKDMMLNLFCVLYNHRDCVKLKLGRSSRRKIDAKVYNQKQRELQ